MRLISTRTWRCNAPIGSMSNGVGTLGDRQFCYDGKSLTVKLARFEEGGQLEEWYAMSKARSLAEFKHAHPRVDVRVRVGSPNQMVDQLLDHHLDALLCFDVAPRIGMSFAGEYALKSCVLMPRGHPFADKRALSPPR